MMNDAAMSNDVTGDWLVIGCAYARAQTWKHACVEFNNIKPKCSAYMLSAVGAVWYAMFGYKFFLKLRVRVFSATP
jgi:hypothetical protein